MIKKLTSSMAQLIQIARSRFAMWVPQSTMLPVYVLANTFPLQKYVYAS